MPLGFAWFVEWLPFGQRFVLVEFDDATPPNRHISAALAETEVRGRLRDHGVTGGDIDVGLASAKIRADADRVGPSAPDTRVSTDALPARRERPVGRRS